MTRRDGLNNQDLSNSGMKLNNLIIFPDTSQRSIYRNIYIPSAQKVNKRKSEFEKKMSTGKLTKLHELFKKSENMNGKYRHRQRNSNVKYSY